MIFSHHSCNDSFAQTVLKIVYKNMNWLPIIIVYVIHATMLLLQKSWKYCHMDWSPIIIFSTILFYISFKNFFFSNHPNNGPIWMGYRLQFFPPSLKQHLYWTHLNNITIWVVADPKFSPASTQRPFCSSHLENITLSIAWLPIIIFSTILASTFLLKPPRKYSIIIWLPIVIFSTILPATVLLKPSWKYYSMDRQPMAIFPILPGSNIRTETILKIIQHMDCLPVITFSSILAATFLLKFLENATIWIAWQPIIIFLQSFATC